MIANNPVQRQAEYAPDAFYKAPPPADDMANGVIPLDTLPAQWWNWLWEQATTGHNDIKRAVDSLIAELQNLITEAGMVPLESDNTQVAEAVKSMTHGEDSRASDTTLGTVKSSSDVDKITVNADGTMTPNNAGALSGLTTTVKTSLVAAINSLKSALDTEATTRANADTTLTTAIGTLSTLKTTNKTSLVAALNEVISKGSTVSVTYDTSSYRYIITY